MITSKAQMLKVIATCAQTHTLTREEKFQVFCNVCDNMLAEEGLQQQSINNGLTSSEVCQLVKLSTISPKAPQWVPY